MAGNEPFDLDERVKNYLKYRERGNPNDPQYMYGKGAIEQAGLQGVARGMAQLGTVHGKAPSAEPFVQASEKGLEGLEVQAKEPAIDPQVMQYLLSRTKHPGKNPLTASKLLPQRNESGNYLMQDNTGGIVDSNIKGYTPPVAEKEKKSEGSNLPIDKKKTVEKLATDIAQYKSSRGLLEGGIQQYNNSLAAYKKSGIKADSDAVVRNGQALLKVLNSPLGSDAVGAEEVQRIGNALKYQFANITNPGSFWGFDFEGFKRQLNSARDKIKYAEDSLQSQIDMTMGRPVQNNSQPTSGGDTGKKTVKSAKDLP